METRSKIRKRKEKEKKGIYDGSGCPFTDLNSKDVVGKIMKLLPAEDVCSLGGTCKKMKAVADSETVWFHLLERDYGVKKDRVFDENTSNKEVYKQEKKLEEMNNGGVFSWDLEKKLHQILKWSCERGTIEVAKCCLRRGADIEKADDYGWTALMIASENGHREICELLLNKGGDINKASNSGVTALTYASGNGHKEIVDLLLEKGADIDRADKPGWTALMFASKRGYKEIVEILLNNGADINKANINGKTALMYASRHGHKEIVELLLNNGADIGKANNRGWTPLMCASEDIVELLEKKIKKICP